MRQMIYMVKVSLLKGAIQKFLGRKNIGMYKNEADLRLHLAADLKEKK